MWTSYRASHCSLPPDKFDSNCRLAELHHAVEGDNVATAYRQGNDVGSSYRCSIFFTTDKQQRVAEDREADVNALELWSGKVVTEVVPTGEFWEAEPEHLDYLERIPNGYTCRFIRAELDPSKTSWFD
jgi:peptide methionine sulfoxide reductase MsrA